MWQILSLIWIEPLFYSGGDHSNPSVQLDLTPSWPLGIEDLTYYHCFDHHEYIMISYDIPIDGLIMFSQNPHLPRFTRSSFSADLHQESPVHSCPATAGDRHISSTPRVERGDPPKPRHVPSGCGVPSLWDLVIWRFPKSMGCQGGTPNVIIHFERWYFPWHEPSSDKGVALFQETSHDIHDFWADKTSAPPN